jgi:type VI secretion system protein ImpB
MARSIHKDLEQVRKPRVHIKYEVHIGDATEVKELPFVVGVLGDFSGHPTKPLDPLSKRKFIQIDRDNFNDVMARLTPGINLRVENTLAGDGSEMAVPLTFNSIEDFEPANIVKQVKPLRELLETRDKLRSLLNKVDRSDELENLLERILQDAEQIKTTAAEIGSQGPATSDKKEEQP